MNSFLKRLLLIIGSIVVICITAASIYSYTLYQTAEDTVEIMYEERKASKKRIEKIEVKELSPISFALLGVDERTGDIGRSDTIIVITVNPNTNTTKMVSIPRDTRTEIVGKDKLDKINHAYAFGGTDMAINTLENFLDIPIDYFVKVNMEGFQEAVDAIGGVNVQNKMAFTNGPFRFEEGVIPLDGRSALAYSRMRKDDPNNDFGRQNRQRDIIKALINKGASLSSITHFDDLFEVLGQNVKTNLSFNEMLEIQKLYRDASKNIEPLEIRGKDQYIDNLFYYIVSDEERKALSSELKTHLELDGSGLNRKNEMISVETL